MNLSQMKYFKQQKGYSYAKMSELSGVPVGTIQKIFNGETKSPRYDTLQALEKILKPQEEPGMVREAVRYCSGRLEYTVDDYYMLPEEQRVELIDGVFYDMASPSLKHQMISMQISVIFAEYIRKSRGTGTVFTAPVDVQLDCDMKTMVQPDIILVCDKGKLSNRCVIGAPDFVLEILSPATREKDAYLKLYKYKSAGVREYWMVDADKGRVVIYFFEEDEIPVIYGFGDVIPVRIYGGKLKIDFSAIREAVEGIGQ